MGRRHSSATASYHTEPRNGQDFSSLTGQTGGLPFGIRPSKGYLCTQTKALPQAKLVLWERPLILSVKAGANYSGQAGDFDFRVWLPMALFLEIAALLAVADHANLIVLTLFNEFSGDFGTSDVWCAESDLGTIVGKEDFVKSNLATL